jgi:hypothetical protein
VILKGFVSRDWEPPISQGPMNRSPPGRDKVADGIADHHDNQG